MLIRIDNKNRDKELHYLYNYGASIISIYTRISKDHICCVGLIELEKNNKVVYISDFKFIERLEII